MTQAPLRRRPITQGLLSRFQKNGDPVGLLDTPSNSGWKGQPGKAGSVFRQYAVLNTMPASVSEGTLHGTSEWRLPYLLTSYGVIPEQVELLADQMRDLVVNWPDITINDGQSDWRVHHVSSAAIGPLVRHEGYDPNMFSQADTYQVWITKEY